MQRSTYKAKLEWAFDVVSHSKFGDEPMRKRIPQICLDVDHARRLRNLWMHNSGLYNNRYKNDGITVNGNAPVVESG